MQDDWTELLGSILDNANNLDNDMKKITPMLVNIQQNSKDVNPEVKSMLDREIANISSGRARLDAMLENVRNIRK